MKRKLSLILMTILIIAVFAGCSGETKSEAPKKPSKQEDQSEVIKIGVSAPITGNYAEYGKGFSVSTNMAVEKINGAGGINGKMIQLVIMDSKGDAKESADIARIFSEDEEISAVIGDFSSTCCMAGAPIYEENKLIQISPTASHPDFAPMGDYMFGIVGRQDDEGPFMAKYVASKYMEANSVGIIYINNDWGVVTTETFSKECDGIGVEVTAKESFIEGEKDFTTVLNKIRQTKPDVICLMTQYNEAAIICKQIKQMNWDVKIMAAGSIYSDQLIQLGGSEVEGIITESPFIIQKDDAVAMEFATEFENRAGFKPNIHAASAYDATMLVGDAMKRSTSLSREGIRDALYETKDFIGITGPIKFTENGDVHKKYRIMTIKDGEWVALTDYSYYDD